MKKLTLTLLALLALAPLADLAEAAAAWAVERAEELVPGGWETWCAIDPTGPVAVWLRRPTGTRPGTAGRPVHPD